MSFQLQWFGWRRELCTSLVLSLFVLPWVAMSSCDLPPTVLPAVEVTSCALTDDKFSLVLKHPKAARAYFEELGKRLKAKDGDAVRETADLVARLVECLPNAAD